MVVDSLPRKQTLMFKMIPTKASVVHELRWGKKKKKVGIKVRKEIEKRGKRIKTKNEK